MSLKKSSTSYKQKKNQNQIKTFATGQLETFATVPIIKRLSEEVLAQKSILKD